MQKIHFSPFKLSAFIVGLCLCFVMVHEVRGIQSNALPDSASSRVAGAGASFGMKLLARLNRNQPAGNIFFSPASIAWCLTMVLNGAEGSTQDEILSTLEAQGLNIDDLNSAFKDWKQSWSTVDPKIEIEVANSIWSRKGINIRSEFTDRNRTYFDSQITELDFNDPRSIARINTWVKDKTRGKIEKIVDDISPDSVLFLMNAIYFNGQWTREFDDARTKQERFLTPSGPKQAPMMRQNGTHRYSEGPEFQAISLPYGDRRMSMYVFLPASTSSLRKFNEDLNSASWQRWIADFEEADGEIALPRFRVSYDVTLNEPLKSLGMRSAFDPGSADFGKMIMGQGKAYISSVKHKAVAEVTEKGTVATAATSTEMRVVSMPVERKTFQMIVNRPFVFVIRDNSSGLLLFIGAITDPTA